MYIDSLSCGELEAATPANTRRSASVGPASKTLGQHCASVGWASVFAGTVSGIVLTMGLRGSGLCFLDCWGPWWEFFTRRNGSVVSGWLTGVFKHVLNSVHIKSHTRAGQHPPPISPGRVSVITGRVWSHVESDSLRHLNKHTCRSPLNMMTSSNSAHETASYTSTVYIRQIQPIHICIHYLQIIINIQSTKLKLFVQYQ